MTDLAKKKCIPCEGNIPPFNPEEIHKYLKKINGWPVIEAKIAGFHLIKNVYLVRAIYLLLKKRKSINI